MRGTRGPIFWIGVPYFCQFLAKVSRFSDITKLSSLDARSPKCIKFDFGWGLPQTQIWELTAPPEASRLIRAATCSGVTRNSGPLDKNPSRVLPPFSLPSLFLLPRFPFPSLPTPARPSLPSPSSSSLLFPTLFPLPPSPPHLTARESGERYIPQPVQAEPGRQTHFRAVHSPKSANLLQFYLRAQFFCMELRSPALEALDFAHPAYLIATPLATWRRVKKEGSIQLLTPVSSEDKILVRQLKGAGYDVPGLQIAFYTHY